VEQVEHLELLVFKVLVVLEQQELAGHLEPLVHQELAELEVQQDQLALKVLVGLELPALVGLVGLPEPQE
jgi:hypothetical protein